MKSLPIVLLLMGKISCPISLKVRDKCNNQPYGGACNQSRRRWRTITS